MIPAEIRICTHCGLRYPWQRGQPHRETCPRCGERTRRGAAWQLTPDQPFAPAPPPARQVGLVLDNLRSAFNVGALFRTADGLGAAHIWLGGITPTPAQPGVGKTALGAEAAVPWTYAPNTADLLPQLHAAGWTIWALEQTPNARPLGDCPPPADKLALVVGNEVSGVGPDLFPLCDASVYLPMHGVKRSLNVEVAAAIALWHLLQTPASENISQEKQI